MHLFCATILTLTSRLSSSVASCEPPKERYSFWEPQPAPPPPLGKALLSVTFAFVPEREPLISYPYALFYCNFLYFML